MPYTKEEKSAYMKVWREKNRDHIKAYEAAHVDERRSYLKKSYHKLKKERHVRVATWKAKHPDKAKAYDRKAYRNNAEHRKEKAAEYYANNKPVIRVKLRQYALANRDKRRSYYREWYKKNPHIAKAGADRRRAVLAGATVGNTRVIAEWEMRWKMNDKNRCYWCLNYFLPTDCRADHIIPLDKKGPHCIENLCIACVDCNSKKHARVLSDWNSELLNPVLEF